MNNFNPNIHHRRSIRLRGYDYSQAGLYFITICCQDHACLFGNVANGQMVLNEAGKMASACWLEIPDHYKNVVLHEFVIMPNHIHGIVELAVGANNHSPVHANNHSPVHANNHSPENKAKNISPPRGTSQTIGAVVRGFKIGVTKWMRQNTEIYDVWQRNYYEHIIRNEQSYDRIAKYIILNPSKWRNDKFYGK